jgi:anaerobic selenocysteine-containing dehydrogenase
MGSPVARAFPVSWQTFEDLLQDRLRLIGASWDTLRDLGLWLVPGYRFARRGSETWISEVMGPQRRNVPRDGRFDFFSRELFHHLYNKNGQELAALGITVESDAVFLPHYEEIHYQGGERDYPLLLNMITLMSLGPYSANANCPTLQEISGMTVGETWGSWLEMNPETAEHYHLNDHDEVWVESQFGRLQTKLRLVQGLRPGVVNLPYNQGHTAVGRWAKGRGVNGLEILNPASEPATGLASMTNTRVRVYRVGTEWESPTDDGNRDQETEASGEES